MVIVQFGSATAPETFPKATKIASPDVNVLFVLRFVYAVVSPVEETMYEEVAEPSPIAALNVPVPTALHPITETVAP